MASFKLGDIVIDRIQTGYAEDLEGTPLYALSQLDEATINISAESKEAKDRDGVLIKKFWTAKSGTLEAKNAMLNLNVIGTASGSDAEIATSQKPITMPKIIIVENGATGVTLTGFVDGTVKVNKLEPNGAISTAFVKDTTASATAYALTTEGAFTPPTGATGDRYLVRYDRSVTAGIALYNKADKFPKTVRLILKALCVDPCDADTLRACYIVLPSFQISPEVNISLQTDGTLDYKGDLQADYCSADKSLYEFYLADDDEE